MTTSLYTPQPPAAPISPLSIDSLTYAIASSSVPGSAAWPAANRALFFPFRTYVPTTFAKMFVINGTAVSGNIDMGVYDEYGNRLVSMGATTQAGTSVYQELNISDYLLGVGLFYKALSCDNTTSQFFRRGTNVNFLKGCGALKVNTAHPLPATVTFTTFVDNYTPLFALSMDSLL